MGTKRSKSEDKLRLRLDQPTEDRETLLPCEVCNGQGSKLVTSGGRYRMKKCPWCYDGYVDTNMRQLWRRWTKILKHNQKAGKCPTANPPRR